MADVPRIRLRSHFTKKSVFVLCIRLKVNIIYLKLKLVTLTSRRQLNENIVTPSLSTPLVHSSRSETGNAPVVYSLDLTSLKSIRECADEINKNESRVDILINNAGPYIFIPIEIHSIYCSFVKRFEFVFSHFFLNRPFSATFSFIFFLFK